MTPERKPGLSVFHQWNGIYVIGTEDIRLALREVGISPETHKWSETNYGYVVRRQGQWDYHPGYPQLPKDAKPCVSFHGPIKETS